MRESLRFFKNLILKNWWLKLAGLLLAYALWLMVRGSEGERVFTVPLVVQIPRNMEIVNQRPSTAEITTLGSTSLTDSQPNLNYTINLQSVGEGEQTVSLNPAGVRVSPASGLTVIRVNPARITLVLERIASKDVPVKVPIQGTPATGLDFYRLTCQPSVVRITGPRSSISRIKEAQTEPVSIAGQNHSFQTIVNFSVQDDDMHMDPAAVAVNVEMGAHRVVRTFRIPVTAIQGDAFTVNPPFVSVSVLVPVTFKGHLTAEDFRATASMLNSGPNSYRVIARPEVEIRADLDAGIRVKQITPDEVTLLRKARKK